MNPFVALSKLAEFVDPVLAMEVMVECGAESLEVGDILLYAGTYRPAGKIIRIDPRTYFAAMALRMSRRFGFPPLTKRDAALLTLLHEAKHCLEGDTIVTMDPTEREQRADEFAVKRFLELRSRR